MTSLLPAPTIRLLTEALVPAGLVTSDARAALLQGIHQEYALSLPNAGNDLDQVRSDLAELNQVAKLDNGQVPLRIWLENAAGRLKLSGRTEAALFQRALAELNTGSLSGLRPDEEVSRLPAPTAPESFAGRAEETRRLAAALQRPGASATAAIQGTGGMGKTTLARQLAHDLAPQFAGGVLWLEIGRGPAAASQALDAETARQTQRAGALIKIARALRVDLSLMPGPDEQLALVRDTLARRHR